MTHAQLRRGWTHGDVEDAVRLSLVYSLQRYAGDEDIKTFVWDLITPKEFGGSKITQGHTGLSAPVPRGRKGKKSKNTGRSSIPDGSSWAQEEKYDAESFLEKSYRKHLDRHNNKLLLRIRMLFYIHNEILGEHKAQINKHMTASDLRLVPPMCEGLPPMAWWDAEADKSLLVGTFKHGFERYNMMRLDPALCFLAKCGPPDNAAVQAELDNLNKPADDRLDDDDDSSSATPSRPASPVNKEDESSSGLKPFPDCSGLNSRLRKLVTAYQREFQKEEARAVAMEKRNEKRKHIENIMREREKQKNEQQQKKWSRREEQNFLKTILAFGIEFSKKDSSKIVWDRFRALGRLDNKYDETLLDYYVAFIAMCKRVAGMELSEEEELVSGSVETIGEEKAKKVLTTVDFLSKLREEVVTHPELREKLELHAELALDLPEWWIPGKHDHDLVVGAARHGLARMEYYVLNDMELSFKDILKRCLEGKPLSNPKELEEWEAKREERQKNKANTNGEAKNGESKDNKGKKKERKRTESSKSIEGEAEGEA